LRRYQRVNYSEAIQFLYGLQMFGANFGLENTRQLAALAGNPQTQLPLHPRRRHERQRLDLRHARKHLSRSGIARRTFHLAASRFVP